MTPEKQELRGAALDRFLLRKMGRHWDGVPVIPIQISVYDHKLIIWNAGQLPPDWSLARLIGKHASQPANPDIARAMFLAGKIESWGRGIDLMRNACLGYGSPAPLFDCDSGGFWLEFAFPPADRDEKTSVKRPEWGEKWGEKTTATRWRIVQAMHRNPHISIKGLAAELGMSTSGIENHLKIMRETACISRVGPAKDGHWEVMDAIND